MERCVAFIIDGIDISMSVKEELDTLMTPIARCPE